MEIYCSSLFIPLYLERTSSGNPIRGFLCELGHDIIRAIET
jgi:hypothetical protein